MNTSLAKPTTPNKREAKYYYQPRYHVDRSDDDTLVQVELPGVSKENLSISIENNELILEGSVASARPDSWKALHRETRDRTYYLRLRLGDLVDQSSIKAQLDDGVLSLAFPKVEAAKPRKIKVS